MIRLQELEYIRTFPAYKIILKTLLHSQIQVLVEQLSDLTGEDSLVLTVGVDDGTLCQLGSTNGNNFIGTREDIKTDFLEYCLLNHTEVLAGKHSNTEERNVADMTAPFNEECPANKHFNVGLEPYSSKRRNNAAISKSVLTKHRRKSNGDQMKSSSRYSGKIESGNINENLLITSGGDKNISFADKCQQKSSIIIASHHTGGRQSQKGSGVNKSKCNRKDLDLVDVNTHDNSIDVKENREHSVQELYNTAELDKSYCKNIEADVDCEDVEESIIDDKDVTKLMDENCEKPNYTNIESSKDYVEQRELNDKKIEKGQHCRKTSTKRKITRLNGKLGHPLDSDCRTSIILEILSLGGEAKTGCVPIGVYTKVADKLGLHLSTVSRIWDRYVNDGTIDPRKS